MSDLPYDFEGRAAEYVLGVLPIGEARLLEREMLSNPHLAQAVARWEQRLAPLATAIAPVTPPEDLWTRIERELPAEPIAAMASARVETLQSDSAAETSPDVMPAETSPREVSAEGLPEAVPAETPQSATPLSTAEEPSPAPVVEEPVTPPKLLDEPPATKPVTGLPPWITSKPAEKAAAPPRLTLWNNPNFWRATTAGGLALAAALALFAIVRAPEAPQYHAAIVAMEKPGATWMAETMPDGRIKLTAMTPIEKPPNSDLELWALPKGVAKPIPMGIIPASGVMMVPGHDMKMDGLQLLVSLEPPGGSPSGSPTGPVLYGGTLKVANPT